MQADGAVDDVTLIERIRAGDARAVAALYDRHNRLLFSLILRVLRDRGEAEEVLQEVLVQVWTRAATYSPALGSVTGWLVRVARNRAIDRLRANSVRLRVAERSADPPGPDDRDDPESHAAASERQRAVSCALGKLPREQRELIEQAFFLGLTHSELAERSGLPLGTVKTRIRTGMLMLRQELQQLATGR